MLKRNPFGVVVLNEAEAGLKTMMEEGNNTPAANPQGTDTAPADNPPGTKVGVSRPCSHFAYVERPQEQQAPRRKTDYRPDRSFRCTLGLDLHGKYTDHTNAVCVC